MKRLLLVVTAFSLSVLFLPACSKKSHDRGMQLNVATSAKIKGLDPALAEDAYSTAEILRVYEGLLQYHPFKRPYELIPLLAEKMPEISKNGLVYTFKIRKGVRFQDDPAFPGGKGRELKAEDFVYSLKRLADPKVLSTGWWTLEGRIKGLDEWRAAAKDKPADYSAVVEGLKAIDDYTLRIELKDKYPQLLYALAMPYGVAVAHEAVEKYGKEFLNHAVGTGPFVLESFKPSEIITYNKNPNYWEAYYPSEGEPGDKEAGLLDDAGKRLPFLDRIEVRVIVEEQPRWLHFMSGDLDTTGIPKDNFGQAVHTVDVNKPLTEKGNLELNDELKKKGIQLSSQFTMDFTYTAFNLESDEIPQFKDKRVRQAISLALDEKESIKVFYNGLAIPAQTPIPPGLPGYDPNYKNPYRAGDITLAKKLLAEAGYPGGKGFPVIPYDTISDSTSRQMTDYVQKNLSQIGLTIKPNPNTWPEFIARIQRRQTQLWGIAWNADYPDAENFLQLFYGPNAQPGGMNSSYYKNKKFDELFVKARKMPESKERAALYMQLSKMVAEDTPVIFGVHRMAVGLRQPWLKNAKYDEFHINRAKYLRVDTELKKKLQQ